MQIPLTIFEICSNFTPTFIRSSNKLISHCDTVTIPIVIFNVQNPQVEVLDLFYFHFREK